MLLLQQPQGSTVACPLVSATPVIKTMLMLMTATWAGLPAVTLRMCKQQSMCRLCLLLCAGSTMCGSTMCQAPQQCTGVWGQPD
jgi:hypothetical protein